MASHLVISSPVNNPSDALRVLLQTSFKHMADFQVMMLEIVAEKYGHGVDEMIEVIKAHPRYKQIQIEPLISLLADDAKQEIDELSEMMEETRIHDDGPAAAAPAAPAQALLKTKNGNKFVIKKTK